MELIVMSLYSSVFLVLQFAFDSLPKSVFIPKLALIQRATEQELSTKSLSPKHYN